MRMATNSEDSRWLGYGLFQHQGIMKSHQRLIVSYGIVCLHAYMCHAPAHAMATCQLLQAEGT